MSKLKALVNFTKHPLDDAKFRSQCCTQLADNGVLVLPEFLTPTAIDAVRSEGEQKANQAYFTNSSHNVYLSPADETYANSHIRNRLVSSSKGCITSDQIAGDSPLTLLYENEAFKSFLCAVLNEKNLYEYADNLSSINLHYAAAGQELGWHYDNSSFAITLLIQKPLGGGVFEYVKDVRDADANDMAFEATENVVNGQTQTNELSMDEGALVLFRGRNSIHRVTPTQGNITRMLVVLAYNSQPGISLSESARQTFYGRLS